MRRILPFALLVLFTITFFACNNSDSEQLSSNLVNNPTSYNSDADGKDIARIAFDTTVYDLGTLIDGEVATYAFHFTNVGNKDLVISKVHTSCGCTASEYPTQAIKPGKGGQIKVKFDSSNRKGFQNKTITVSTNGIPAAHMLRIKANVIAPTQ